MGYLNKAIVIFLFINIFTSLAMEILNDADLTDFNDIGNDLVKKSTRRTNFGEKLRNLAGKRMWKKSTSNRRLGAYLNEILKDKAA